MPRTPRASRPIQPLRTRRAYQAAQRRAAELLVATPSKDSAAGQELEILGILIEAYDREHFPLGPSDPIVAIAFATDQHGLEPKDLVPFLGTRSRVTEVLKGHRALSLEQIRRLHRGLGIPLEGLIADQRRPHRPGTSAGAATAAGRRRRRAIAP